MSPQRAAVPFTLETLAGNDRKTSGAYYTPTPLIDCVLDSALDPLLDRAERDPEPAEALLDLTVCDPACGSGHFLVAAAKRIAHRVARVRAEGTEPTIEQSQEAMHDVVARCIYGVDLNPMAAELAKVSLWLEALAAGRPLGFLDAHIKVGNALLGTTPALLAAGIPDEAFAAIEGDDKKAVSSLKKQNKHERAGQGSLFAEASIPVDNRDIANVAREIDSLAGLSLADVHLARQRQRELETSAGLRRARLLADAWCTAFVARKEPGQPRITHGTIEAWSREAPGDQDPAKQVVARAAAEYRFFHWHLEFPQIFASDPDAPGNGWRGGFDCVLGNPPWERVKLQEQEFFAARSPDVSGAPNAAVRKRLIRALETVDPVLYDEFRRAKRRAEGESHLLRSSGRYPLNGRGDINTYAVFAEHDRAILSNCGRLGVILPAGIATDATTQEFFRSLVATRSLAALYHFENEGRIFEGVHNAFRFCVLVVSGSKSESPRADFAFFARHPADLGRVGARFTMSPEEIQLLNPNSGTCPVFRSRRDAELALNVYRHVPVLVKRGKPIANPWGASFSTMYHMSNDSNLFATADQLDADGWTRDGNRYRRGSSELLPLYEGKMIHHFDHRFGTYDGQTQAQANKGDLPQLTDEHHADPRLLSMPRYWLAAEPGPWQLGFRDITGSEKVRTMVAALMPGLPAGHTLPVASTERAHLLAGIWSSFVFDYFARQKVGGTHMTYFVLEQLPVPSPDELDAERPWGCASSMLEPRVLELSYTAWDMNRFARDLGDEGPPFRWDPERRSVLRAEVDAVCFHLYGILDRDDVDYILGTFPIVNRKDVERFGEERTRRLVLENFDAITESARAGLAFRSTLSPPPGRGPRHASQEDV